MRLNFNAARIMSILAFVLAAWVAFTFSFTPLRASHDEFWHLKTGQWIAEHGRLPANDIFTFTAENMAWDNHEWLTQFLMWEAYHFAEQSGFGGWRAVILIKSILIVLAFAGFGLLLARRLREPLWGAVAAMLAAALARRTFYPRPPVVTYLLMAIVFWLLFEWRAGRLKDKWLWLLPPIFALWANLHGGWQAGLVIVAAFGADALFARRKILFISLTGIACGLATLVNPFGWKLFLLAGRALGDPYLTASIGEMLPPEWKHVWILGGILILMLFIGLRPENIKQFLMATSLATLAGCWFRFFSDWRHGVVPVAQYAVALPIFVLAARRSPLPGRVAQFFLLAFFGWQAMAHVRHLPLLGIVMMPALAAGLDAWGAPKWNRTWKCACGVAALAGLAFFWTFNHLELFSYLERNIMLAHGAAMQPILQPRDPADLPVASEWPQRGVFVTEAYPVRAVNFLLQARLPGRLWNGGNYAGYLIWRLSPETMKVFTDNRYDVFGGMVIRDEHSVLNGWDENDLLKLKNYYREADWKRMRPWHAVLDDWKIQTVFIPVQARGNMRLAAGGWARVYEDFNFAIWVRDTPENKSIVERAKELPKPLPWVQ